MTKRVKFSLKSTSHVSAKFSEFALPYFSRSRAACALCHLRRYVVEERFLGTAYGLITAVQNAGLAGVPLLAGYIKDSTNNWSYGMFR